MLAMALPAAHAARAPASDTVPGRGVAEIEVVSRDATTSAGEQARQIDAIYKRRFRPYLDPVALGRTSDADIRQIFQGAVDAGFYTLERNYALDGAHALQQLKMRGLATKGDYDDLSSLFIRMRDTVDAREIARQGKLPTDDIPDIQDMTGGRTGRTLISVGEGNALLQRRSFSIDQHGVQMVVVSSPHCHFTVNAVADIAKNPALEKAMAKHSTWIVPPYGSFDIADTRQWNVAHPAESMRLIYSPDEWADIDTRATPQFYVFKNGKLQKKIVGWRGKNTEDELISTLNQLGALDPSQKKGPG
jgi:hypothetical protein